MRMRESRMVLLTLSASIGVALLMARNAPLQAMPADAQRPDNLESVRTGHAVAKRICSACHAIEARGESPNPRAPRFPLIAERYPDNNPSGELVDGTVFRHPGMPEFRLPEYETDGLVAYLRRISRKWRPET